VNGGGAPAVSHVVRVTSTARRAAPLAAGVVSAIGLLVALAATLDPAPPPGGAPGGSLVVRLPDTVRSTVLVLIGLSAIILLAFVRSKRRRVAAVMLDRDRRAHRLPAWAAALFSLPVMLPIAVLAYLVWSRSYPEQAERIDAAFAMISNLLDLLARSRKPDTSMPLFDAAVAMLAVAAAFAVFVLIVLVALPDRAAGRAGEDAALPETVTDSIDTIRADPDARLAVIRAYRRFERALAAARVPRAPWQTPSELARELGGRSSVPRAPVECLTALFETARFSGGHVGPDARDLACDCVEAIEATLEQATALVRETTLAREPILEPETPLERGTIREREATMDARDRGGA
jgi:uncharacterized protein DUF4129